MDDLRVDCCTEDFAISKVLFNLDSLEAWGHETIMSRTWLHFDVVCWCTCVRYLLHDYTTP